MDDPYVPIACAMHERLEFAVLRGHALDLSWIDGIRVERARVVPLDVYTCHGAEWLRVRFDDGRQLDLRLDRIREFREVTSG